MVREQEGTDKIFWALVFRGRYMGFLFPYFLCLEVEFCLSFFACIYQWLYIFQEGNQDGLVVLFCGAGWPTMPLDFSRSRSLFLLCPVTVGVVL